MGDDNLPGLFFEGNMIIYRLLIFKKNIFKTIGNYFNQMPLSLEFSIFAIIFRDLLIIVAMINWMVFFSTYLKDPNRFFHLSTMRTFDTFDFLENFFDDNTKIFYFNMYIVFILLFKVIFDFNSLYPSFGLHLLTFSKAKVDLLMFLLFAGIILISFGVWANLSLGSEHKRFSDFGKTMVFLFHFVRIFLL